MPASRPPSDTPLPPPGTGPRPGGGWSARRDAVSRGLRSAWDRRSLVEERAPQLAVLAGLLLVVLGSAGFVGVLDAVQEMDDLAELDQPVLEGLVAARSEVLTVVLTAITTVTGPDIFPIVVVVAAVLWGLVGRAWWQAALLAGAMIGSTLLSVGLKRVIARPRPPVDTMSIPGYETTYSFPSGHTIGTATFLLVVGYLAWVRRPTLRRLLLWIPVVLLGIGLVAGSRLYLGYHFVTDVVASTALAVAVLGGVVVLDRRRAARAAQQTAEDTGGSGRGPGRPRQDSNLRPAD